MIDAEHGTAGSALCAHSSSSLGLSAASGKLAGMQPTSTAERYALARSAYASAIRRGDGFVKVELRALLLAAFDHHRLRYTILDLAQDNYRKLFALLFGALIVEVVCAFLFHCASRTTVS